MAHIERMLKIVQYGCQHNICMVFSKCHTFLLLSCMQDLLQERQIYFKLFKLVISLPFSKVWIHTVSHNAWSETGACVSPHSFFINPSPRSCRLEFISNQRASVELLLLITHSFAFLHINDCRVCRLTAAVSEGLKSSCLFYSRMMNTQNRCENQTCHTTTLYIGH